MEMHRSKNITHLRNVKNNGDVTDKEKERRVVQESRLEWNMEILTKSIRNMSTEIK